MIERTCVAVIPADRAEHQALAGCEADPDAPFLPIHQVAVDREAGTVRLDDVEVLEVVAHGSDIFRFVVAALARDWRDRVEIVDPNDFLRMQVEEDAKVLDRVRVPIVIVMTVLDPDETAYPTPIGEVLLVVIGAGGPGVDPAELHIGHASPGHGSLEAVMFPQRGFDAEDFRHGEWRLTRRNLTPVDDLARAQGDQEFQTAPLDLIDDDRLGNAIEMTILRSVFHGEHDGFGRLEQFDRAIEIAIGFGAGLANDADRLFDLIDRQGIERMGRSSGDIDH